MMGCACSVVLLLKEKLSVLFIGMLITLGKEKDIGGSVPDQHNYERICVVFFENAEHYVIVAPDHRHPTPTGFERRECRSLREIDALTSRLQRQDKAMFNRMWEKDRQTMIQAHDRHRTALRQRLLAPDCGPGERMFIQRAFDYFDRKEDEYNHFHVSGFFHQREYDGPGTDPVEDHGRQGPTTKPKMSDRLAALISR
jgi:hypothetical protein